MTEQEEFSKINSTDNQNLKIDVIHEHLLVGKEMVETGKVTITKKVHEVEETYQASVKSEEIKVEKVAVNRYVDSYPEVRYEGETMIVPVVKEVLVVEKKLLLVEEVYISKNISISEEENVMPLRREEITVERTNNQNTQF